ncbi:MAG: glutamate-5-semialdehyde dehydrogenase [Halothece sp. Uz-M2-17]|nr:glutamate-5-semialdehyde dehydrogenase [Halothece sp. Uz-M2-17]
MVASQTTPDRLSELAQRTQNAAQQLAVLSTQQRNQALSAIAQALADHEEEIVAANATDCEQAKQDGIPEALQARLKLDQSKLQSAIAGVKDVAKLRDPLGTTQIHRELDTGLVLKRISCPVGVLGVIFEARPDALIQITSLAIKSGNGVILKGGKEALNSCQTLTKVIHQALATTDVPSEVVQLLTTRAEIQELLSLDQYVDLIIPRGSNSFVRFIQENTRIPVLGHADGICHIYVDEAVNLEQAVKITVDSKTQYPAACNAVETLLVHRTIASNFLPQLEKAITERGVTLRGDEASRQILPQIEIATAEDWSTEYGGLVLAVKVVASAEEAMAHITTYGSRHTEAILTENAQLAQTFLNQVDAAGVFHNCSTRFSDGFRYGFGAEVGISTQKMPPRGPVGLEGLVTYKYQVTGDGHIAETYSGKNPKPFTHKDFE